MLCSIIGEVSYSSAMNQSSIKTWWMKFGTWVNGPRRFCKLLICRRQRRRFQREPIPYICDFSRCRLNVRLTAYIQPLLQGHKYRVWSLLGSCLWRLEENQNSCWRDLRGFRRLWLFKKSNLKRLTFKLLSLCYNNKLSFKHALIHMQINLVPLQHFSC